MNPSISEAASTFTWSENLRTARRDPNLTLPVIDRRDLDAMVRVSSGETLVLAGIIQHPGDGHVRDHHGRPLAAQDPLPGHALLQ